jgi:hypothetical protein
LRATPRHRQRRYLPGNALFDSGTKTSSTRRLSPPASSGARNGVSNEAVIGFAPTPDVRYTTGMKYQLYTMKLEQLISYFQTGAINLAPAFQRGKVWPPSLRKHLLKNILHGKPVPAIFLFKKPVGERNSYVIIDGKQRLESILLYVADLRDKFGIPNWKDYFSRKEEREEAGFRAKVNGDLKNINELSTEEIIRFRDYLLSIIEIEIDDPSLSEIIQLFVDINQYGVKVKRFHIVKALYQHDPLLHQVFDLVAQKWQTSKRDPLLKLKHSVFRKVLEKLDSVNRISSVANRIDVIWEKMFEFALFAHSLTHRKPSDILKEFIGKDKNDAKTPRLTNSELVRLNRAFTFIWRGYQTPGILKSKWATDQTHFYIMASSFIKQSQKAIELNPDLFKKLVLFSNAMRKIEEERKKDQQPAVIPARTDVEKKVEKYMKLSEKQTTDTAKREERVKLFEEILILL